MIMLDFSGFLVVLVISLVVAALLHYGMRYYVVPGPWSFVSKVIVGFIGGVFGPAIFGHWLVAIAGVPVVPAVIGSAALMILAVDVTHSVHQKMASS